MAAIAFVLALFLYHLLNGPGWNWNAIIVLWAIMFVACFILWAIGKAMIDFDAWFSHNWPSPPKE
jgi:TM2 domain-containing membrane protein YozV